MDWLIWSIEHNAWWKPDARWYTTHRDQAGRHDTKLALKYVWEANKGRRADRPPDEALVPADDEKTEEKG
jgi:hypothetical protein